MEDLKNHIEINQEKVMGKPIIKGTRITVESILDKLASGYTHKEILEAHPNLKDSDILAALHYASAIMKNEKIFISAS